MLSDYHFVLTLTITILSELIIFIFGILIYCYCRRYVYVFIDHVALIVKQGDNALGSVHPSVCPSVSALMPEPFAKCSNCQKLGSKYGQGQSSWLNFWCIAVDIRDSALPSAAKSKKESLSVQGVCLRVE